MFSYAKTNEKTQTQIGLIISFTVLYGTSHLSEIYSVSLQWLEQKPLPPPHMQGSVLTCSRLNALDELKRENKISLWEWKTTFELEKWVFETEVTPSLLNSFPRSWAQGKQCFSLLILSVIVYTPLRVCVYVQRQRFDPAVVHVSLHGVPPLTHNIDTVWMGGTCKQTINQTHRWCVNHIFLEGTRELLAHYYRVLFLYFNHATLN